MRRSNLRVVPDTNVVVSAALFFPSIPQQVIDYVVENGSLLLSAATLHELGEVILRPRFDRRASRERRRDFLNTLDPGGRGSGSHPPHRRLPRPGG